MTNAASIPPTAGGPAGPTLSNPPRAAVTNVASTNAVAAKLEANKGDKRDFWASFVGLIVGACLAYFVDWLKEWRKRRQDQQAAIRRSQLALVGHLNTLNNIRTQYLDPVRDDKERHVKLIHYQMEDTAWRVPYDSIAFLLTTHNPSIVLDVHSAELTYVSAMRALDARNDAYEKLHANSKLMAMDPNTGTCTIQFSDPRYLRLLKLTTDSLYETVDNAMERLLKEIKALNTAGKLLYPKSEFLALGNEKEYVMTGAFSKPNRPA